MSVFTITIMRSDTNTCIVKPAESLSNNCPNTLLHFRHSFMSSKTLVKSQSTEAYLKEVGSLAGEAFEPVDELTVLNIEILVVKVQF